MLLSILVWSRIPGLQPGDEGSNPSRSIECLCSVVASIVGSQPSDVGASPARGTINARGGSVAW